MKRGSGNGTPGHESLQCTRLFMLMCHKRLAVARAIFVSEVFVLGMDRLREIVFALKNCREAF